MKGLVPGRIVTFIYAPTKYAPLEKTVAIVTAVMSKEKGEVILAVFMPNSLQPVTIRHADYLEFADKENTWHWTPKEEEA